LRLGSRLGAGDADAKKSRENQGGQTTSGHALHLGRNPYVNESSPNTFVEYITSKTIAKITASAA
jgi:hypothetical protein